LECECFPFIGVKIARNFDWSGQYLTNRDTRGNAKSGYKLGQSKLAFPTRVSDIRIGTPILNMEEYQSI
jgi:hypothetical protein